MPIPVVLLAIFAVAGTSFLAMSGLRKEDDQPVIGPGQPAVPSDLLGIGAITTVAIIIGGLYLLSRK